MNRQTMIDVVSEMPSQFQNIMDKYRISIKLGRINTKVATFFVTKTIRNFGKIASIRLRHFYAKYLKELPVDSHKILFESREGNAFVGNPYGFFKYLQSDKRFNDYEFYWVYRAEVNLDEIKKNIDNLDRVHFVLRNSIEYMKLMATCGYYFNNTTAQNFYSKREGQVFISTWHGTPLKSLAYDSPFSDKNPFPIRNGMRNFLMSSYLIGPNEHTSKILLDAYKVNGLYDGAVLESGYPRNDLTVNTPKEVILNKLYQAHLSYDESKPTILYTPTWRGNDLFNAEVDIEQMATEIQLLRNHVQKNYNLLVKVHPVAYKKVYEGNRFNDILVPNYLDANEIMSTTDILITDYSSIFFDFMMTDRPIIFYAWDDDVYSKNRNMYLSMNTLPGPVASTIFEVMDIIDHLDEETEKYHDNYVAMKQKMSLYDDGHSAERYVNAIFFNELDQKKLEVRRGNQDKKRLLFYAGSMNNTPITRRFMQLIKKIDFDKYDVTLLMGPKLSHEAAENLRRITAHVRPMFRQGYPIFEMDETYEDELMRKYGVTEANSFLYPKEAYQRESNRIFAGCHFDIAVDFSGDSYYWTRYILEANADHTVIFQQHDMMDYYDKSAHRKKKGLYNSLTALFSVYQYYDTVVSIAEFEQKNRLFIKKYIGTDAFLSLSLSSEDVVLPYPIYQKDKSPNMIELRERLYVKKEGVHQLIPDLKNLERTQYLSISKKDHVSAVMEAEENGVKYVKLLINHVYFGWARADEFDMGYVDVIDVKEQHQYAIIKNPKKYAIYSKPYNTEKGIKRLCFASALRNVMVRVTKLVSTTTTVFAHVEIDKSFSGYLNVKALKVLSGNEMALKINHQLYKEKIINAPRLYEKIEQGTAELKNSEARLWTNYLGARNAEASIYQAETLVDQRLTLLNRVDNICGTFYKVKGIYGEQVWVEEADLKNIDVEKIDY